MYVSKHRIVSSAIPNVRTMKAKKFHIVSCHLPWYLGIRYHHDDFLAKTPLAKQLLPSVAVNFQLTSQFPPFTLFFQLIGKLCDSFLMLIASHLNLSRKEELLGYVIGLKFYPHSRAVIQSDDKLLMMAHMAYAKDTSDPNTLQISPPNSVSACLHWETLTNIISTLPPDTQEMFSKYEGYNGRNLVTRKALSTPVTPNLIHRMQSSIDKDSLQDLQGLLDECPNLATASMPNCNGSPLQYALGLPGCKILCATMLCLYGANTEVLNYNRETAITHYARLHNLKAVKFLIDLASSV